MMKKKIDFVSAFPIIIIILLLLAACLAAQVAYAYGDNKEVVEEGDRFVVQDSVRWQMSFNNGTFVFLGFTMLNRNTRPQLLAGRRSVPPTLDRQVLAKSFNVSDLTIGRLLSQQREAVIVECANCAEEEVEKVERDKGRRNRKRKLSKRRSRKRDSKTTRRRDGKITRRREGETATRKGGHKSQKEEGGGVSQIDKVVIELNHVSLG